MYSKKKLNYIKQNSKPNKELYAVIIELTSFDGNIQNN